MTPEHLTPVPDADEGHARSPVSDLNLDDTLLSLLRRARAVAEVTKWIPLQAFENPNNEALLFNGMDSDLDFADELDRLLLRMRGVCEVVKWTPPATLRDPAQPLRNTLEVVTGLIDEAKALADRWYDGRYPSRAR